MKKYTSKEIEEMGKKADKTVTTMTLTGVGIGFAPVGIDIAAFMTLMGTSVIAIGNCYGMEMNKEEAGELIKQFFKAAGLTLSMVTVGSKIIYSTMKSNPVTYLPFMVADAVICGTTAYAVGSTSKNYFQLRAQGKKASEEDIKRWMEEGKIQGKKVAKQAAKEKANEIKFSK